MVSEAEKFKDEDKVMERIESKNKFEFYQVKSSLNDENLKEAK